MRICVWWGVERKEIFGVGEEKIWSDGMEGGSLKLSLCKI